MTPDGREPFRPAELVWPEQHVASQQLSDEHDADEGGLISLNAQHAQKKLLSYCCCFCNCLSCKTQRVFKGERRTLTNTDYRRDISQAAAACVEGGGRSRARQ